MKPFDFNSIVNDLQTQISKLGVMSNSATVPSTKLEIKKLGCRENSRGKNKTKTTTLQFCTLIST